MLNVQVIGLFSKGVECHLWCQASKKEIDQLLSPGVKKNTKIWLFVGLKSESSRYRLWEFHVGNYHLVRWISIPENDTLLETSTWKLVVGKLLSLRVAAGPMWGLREGIALDQKISTKSRRGLTQNSGGPKFRYQNKTYIRWRKNFSFSSTSHSIIESSKQALQVKQYDQETLWSERIWQNNIKFPIAPTQHLDNL